MKVSSNGINIHLEQEEIDTFWNIIMFALDFHTKEMEKGSCCMNNAELKLTNELIDITDKLK